MKKKVKIQLKEILIAGIVILIGLLLFKYIPMYYFGNGILFDASLHIAFTIFVLYVVWFFIDHLKNWRIPYFIFCGVILIIVAIQRMFSYNHNEVGLILGLVLGVLAIGISQWKKIRNKFEF